MAAPHLPPFITTPGQTDVMMVITGVFLLVIIVTIGVLYFTLHSLPERLAHRTNQAQAGVVAVLCLIALFTHQHIFWIVAILLAFIRIPDFETPIRSISDSLERLAAPQAPAMAGAVAAPALDLPPAEVAEAVAPPAPADTEKREG
jgi:hypothetical protein